MIRNVLFIYALEVGQKLAECSKRNGQETVS